MRSNDNNEMMPDLLAREVLQMLEAEPIEMNELKIRICNYVGVLTTLFGAEIREANRQQDVRHALEDFIQRLSLLTDTAHDDDK